MALSTAKAAPARRNLFGPVDHDHLQQELQRAMSSGLERAKQRWNFDFFRERPTAGPLQWEELRGHEVPAFYHTCVAREARHPLQPLNRAGDRDAKAHLLGREVDRAGPARKGAAKKRRQTYVTDYYATKKQIRKDMQTPVKKLPF